MAGVSAIPLRVTLVSSSNQIGPAGIFDNPPAPSVRSEDVLYHIQVVPPTDARRRPCHSMSDFAVRMANRFRKLFGFEQIEPPIPPPSITITPITFNWSPSKAL